MSKRMLAATLWFAATWFGYEILWSLTGAPRLVGPILAFAVAGAVATDPLHLFWPRRAANSDDAIAARSAVGAPF